MNEQVLCLLQGRIGASPTAEEHEDKEGGKD